MEWIADSPQKKPRRMIEILTVGDGDLTLALALARAYGERQIALTASSIVPDAESLVRLYPNSEQVLKELQEQRHVSVLFGVDATQLHTTKFVQRKLDLILFYHPHLGITKNRQDSDEVSQARRHACLLAHYLASAATCLKPDTGRAHLGLCGTQPDTWKVRETAKRLGLVQIQPGRPTPAAPWHEVMHLSPSLSPNPVEAQSFSAPRRYRSGKQGSRHWLGKYGYRHRRTQGELYEGAANDTNVECSVDLLFQPMPNVLLPTASPSRAGHDSNNSTFTCPICQQQFASYKECWAHMATPALPCDVALATQEYILNSTTDTTINYVLPQCDGKQANNQNGVRLRKYIQKTFELTKSAASRCIAAGKITIDGEVVTDSARLVLENSKVELYTDNADQATPTTATTVSALTAPDALPCSTILQVIACVNDLLRIVHKPVGLRTKGRFSGTLEDLLSRQDHSRVKWESLTRLDTGLSGLCLLYNPSATGPPESARHRFTALVLGRVENLVADDNSTNKSAQILLHSEKRRRWQKGGKPSDVMEEAKDCCNQSSSATPASLRVIQTCCFPVQHNGKDEILTLSTIEVDVVDNLPGIGSLLTFGLRTQFNLRVLGDRFSNQEYGKLPRPMRNRLKQKISLACTSIACAGQEWTIAVPEKWQATYWEHFLQSKGTLDTTLS